MLPCSATTSVLKKSNFSNSATTVEWQGHFPKEKNEPSLFHFKSIHKSVKDVVTTKCVIYEDDIKLSKQYKPLWRDRSGKLYSLNHVYKTNQTYDYGLSITKNCSSVPVSDTPRYLARYTGFVIDVNFTSFIVGGGPYVFEVPIEAFAKFGITTSNVSIPFQYVTVETIFPILWLPYSASLVSVEKIIPKKSLPVVSNPVSKYEIRNETLSAPSKAAENRMPSYSDSDAFREFATTVEDITAGIQLLNINDELESPLSLKKFSPPPVSCITPYEALSPKASFFDCLLESSGIGVVTL